MSLLRQRSINDQGERERNEGRAPLSRTSSTLATEPLVELQQLYFDQLRSDRIQLVSLAASLARGADNAEAPFAEIRMVAHRMRGAAAIFEVPMVECAAAALENAACAAGKRGAHRPDHRVGDALEHLVDCVARLAGSSTA